MAEAGALGDVGAHEGSHCGRRLAGTPSFRLSSQRPLEPKTPTLGPQWVPCSHYKEKKEKDKGWKAESKDKGRKEGRESGRNPEKTRETEALAVSRLPRLPWGVGCLPVWEQKVCHAPWNLHQSPGCVLE